MEDKRKLLILGSDYCTLQVVREAHALGLYVIVSDLMETSPTKEEADEAWMLSTTDTDGLIRRCRDEGVSALMFGASDFNINNARIVCAALDLPIYCTSDYAWTVARDKGEFKRICREVGAPVAEGYALSDALTEEDLSRVVYPVVVKPVDKSGNRGMSYCASREELIAGWKNARTVTERDIVVERQLHGEEYNVHYALADGEARLLYFSATHHQPGMADNLYSFKNTTARHLRQYLDEVNDLAIAVLKRAECRDGIAWFDCMRDVDGHFYLLEMGHRFGGVMTYVPYEKVSGFNTVRWMLECALGVKHTAADLPPAPDHLLPGCAASYHLFTTHAGEIGQMEGVEALERMPNVFVDLPKRVGNSVRDHACMGLLGIYARDAEELCTTLRTINQTLRIRDTTGEDLFIYYDDYAALRREFEAGAQEFNT